MVQVKELIKALQDLDPNAPVWTIDTCECCTAHEALDTTRRPMGLPFLARITGGSP